MITEGKTEAGGLDPRDDEALWTLLGRQEPPVKVSPYFARRVLREVGLEAPRGDGWFERLRRFWTLPSRHAAVWSGAFALGLLCLSAVLMTPGGRSPVVPSVVAPTTVEPGDFAASSATASGSDGSVDHLADANSAQDEEVIADLDNVLSREESRLWTEDTDTARF